MKLPVPFASLLVAATMLGSAVAQVPAMPPIKAFHLEVELVRDGDPKAIIFTGPAEEALALGQELADAIQVATGARLPVEKATVDAAEAEGDRNCIVIGKFDDAAAQYLYRMHVGRLNTSTGCTLGDPVSVPDVR